MNINVHAELNFTTLNTSIESDPFERSLTFSIEVCIIRPGVRC